MKTENEKKRLKKELKRLFKSMDFIFDNYLSKDGDDEKDIETYATIYQQLGMAWEYLGLQCKHWDGTKVTKDKHEVCKICGKVSDVDETRIILPARGHKKIGKKLTPNSKKTFKTKTEAKMLADSIDFHGAKLKIDVHNSYKSKLFGDKSNVNIAAERIVELKENSIKCSISRHTIHIRVKPEKKRGSKPDYGNFAYELKKKELKHFPVIFHFDDNLMFSGLTILR